MLSVRGKLVTPSVVHIGQDGAILVGEEAAEYLFTRPDCTFMEVQRRATSKASELAGLQIERIINEPTAAALDYGLSNLRECKNVLVYDIGGARKLQVERLKEARILGNSEQVEKIRAQVQFMLQALEKMEKLLP